jgi:chemotaxis signal transduction protein
MVAWQVLSLSQLREVMATEIGHQWLLFELAGQIYGFDVGHVREIVSLRHLVIHRTPEAARFVEGVVTLRNEAIEIVEMRSAFGLHSLRDETEAIQKVLRDREQDHCNWLTELEACVAESREFKLATDPHKCKFGQWYDKLRANAKELLKLTNNDLATIDMFEKMDAPHKQVHSIAAKAMGYLAASQPDEAHKLIDDTRHTTLASLRQLFDRCRQQIEIARRGLLFVLVDENDVFGALVDRVAEVVQFSEEDISRCESKTMANGLLYGVAKWGRNNQMVQLLNVPEIARWRLNAARKAVSPPQTTKSPAYVPVAGGSPVALGSQVTSLA